MQASGIQTRNGALRPHAHRTYHRSRQAARRTPIRAVSYSTDGLVLPLGDEGGWDSGAVGNPVVRCYVGDNEQRWFMWYSGRSTPGYHPHLDAITAATGSVGVAISDDGVHWERGRGPVSGARGEDGQHDVGQILGPNTDSWWWLDTCHLSVSDVQVFSNANVSGGIGVYWMMYSGGDFEKVPPPPSMLSGIPISTPEPATAAVLQGSTSSASRTASSSYSTQPELPSEVEGLRLRPGLAMSQDGRNWARIEGEHHTGALFDVGEEGEWDELFVASPKLVAAGPGDMRLYYTSYCSKRQRYVLGLAVSPDGFRWKKTGPMFEGSGQPGAFDEMGVASAHVVRDVDSRKFFMFYEGVAKNGRRSIGLAVSKDGKSKWQCCDKPVLEAAGAGSEGSWDQGSVGAPCAVSMSGGRWRLYYSGRNTAAGPWQGIGLALSNTDAPSFDSAPTSFKRRTGAAV